MTVEALADQAAAKGHELLYVSLSALPSFSIEDGEGGHIFLSRSLCGVQGKEALAHELGHCEYGGFYNRYSKYDIRAKAERRADKWAFAKLVPYGQLMQAVRHGITEVWELAELFDVSCEFMYRAISYYQTAIL